MNKTAIVTGASRGIGRAIAIKFAKNGYDLAICCKKDQKGLENTKKIILSENVSCLSFIGDMGNFHDVEKFFHEILSHYQQIDVLVNNAGISYLGLLQDMTPDDWNHILASNLSSVFYCCKAAIPEMLKHKTGKILSISSIWGNVGASMEVAYSASKGGLNSLTKALAKELAPSGICVNAIACGVIDTQMNGFLSAEEKKDLLEQIPAGRMGSCEEVAELAYMLGSGTDYLTGQIITLDGGFL